MKAYSPHTHRRYESWDALVGAEANGYVVVMVVKREGLEKAFSRTVGPFRSKQVARNAAAKLRRHFSSNPLEDVEYISLLVEPLWPSVDRLMS